jgi:hypothetical protein
MHFTGGVRDILKNRKPCDMKSDSCWARQGPSIVRLTAGSNGSSPVTPAIETGEVALEGDCKVGGAVRVDFPRWKAYQLLCESRVSTIPITWMRRGRKGRQINESLSFQASAGSISSYVGLFDTVRGILKAFRDLTNAQQATLSAVALGIGRVSLAAR